MHFRNVPWAPGVLRTAGLNQDKEKEEEGEAYTQSIFVLRVVIWFRYSDLSWKILCDVIEVCKSYCSAVQFICTERKTVTAGGFVW
jgi:hypothetical protein